MNQDMMNQDMIIRVIFKAFNNLENAISTRYWCACTDNTKVRNYKNISRALEAPACLVHDIQRGQE